MSHPQMYERIFCVSRTEKKKEKKKKEKKKIAMFSCDRPAMTGQWICIHYPRDNGITIHN